MNTDSKLRKSLQEIINAASAENGSNTPDFILAEYLEDCLKAFDKAVNQRSRWYGHPSPRFLVEPEIISSEGGVQK
jgi:hypothetical protein